MYARCGHGVLRPTVVVFTAPIGTIFFVVRSIIQHSGMAVAVNHEQIVFFDILFADHVAVFVLDIDVSALVVHTAVAVRFCKRHNAVCRFCLLEVKADDAEIVKHRNHEIAVHFVCGIGFRRARYAADAVKREGLVAIGVSAFFRADDVKDVLRLVACVFIAILGVDHSIIHAADGDSVAVCKVVRRNDLRAVLQLTVFHIVRARVIDVHHVVDVTRDEIRSHVAVRRRKHHHVAL